MNWRTATETDRKLLYKVLNDLIWEVDWDWSDLMSAAYGRKYIVEAHFAGNF